MDLQEQVVLQQGHSIKWKNITAPFIHSEEVLIYNLVRVSSILSLFGSLFILFTWYAFKDIHFFSRKLSEFEEFGALKTSTIPAEQRDSKSDVVTMVPFEGKS